MTTKIVLENIADTALTTLVGSKIASIVYLTDDTANSTPPTAAFNAR